jgi:hypothetical protein
MARRGAVPLLLRKPHAQPQHRLLASIVSLVLVLVAVARVVATYDVFSQTFDEPAHVAAGMEWLDAGVYQYEVQTPPLARVAAAVGPYLDGLRSTGESSFWVEGNAILDARGTYQRNLELARVGELPFFLLSIAMVGAWARRLFGPGIAIVSVALFTTIPPVLAHAGLATTDVALMGTLAAALLAFACWLERPSPLRGAVLGGAVGLALLAKFSAVVFLLPSALVLVGCAWLTGRGMGGAATLRLRSLPMMLTVVIATGAIVVWAGYHFSVGSIRGVPVPAPEFLRGIAAAAQHDERGHFSYLLGQPGGQGWWYFFPVTLAVKTPIPVLLLGLVGAAGVLSETRRRRNWQPLIPLALPLVLVGAAIPSTIDLGVRHVLTVYVFLSVLAAVGVCAMWSTHGRWRRVGARAAVVVAVLWQVVAGVRAQPDYLAYFNELAGPEPGWILVDSDLDWGQDLPRLAEVARAEHISDLALAYFGTADPRQHGLPYAHPLRVGDRPTGWVAISETQFRRGLESAPDAYGWLSTYQPLLRVGKSMRLYLLSRESGAPAAQSRTLADR